MKNTFNASDYLSNTLDKQLFNSYYYIIYTVLPLFDPNFFQINLMNVLMSPEGLSISQMYRNKRIRRNFKQLFTFT
jgi:hypothetical protein